jgi:hypothetical protein
MKKRIKESFGVIALVLTLITSLIGIYSLSEFITIYGSIFLVCLIFGMYRYA